MLLCNRLGCLSSRTVSAYPRVAYRNLGGVFSRVPRDET